MWFAKRQIETETTLPVETPAEQLEQLRELRRQAKAEYDADWKKLHQFLNTHPPMRRPFVLNGKFFTPVNLLTNVPTEQRELENQVPRSRAKWTALQKQEADFEFAHGLKR
jgi:hypothetical protein